MAEQKIDTPSFRITYFPFQGRAGALRAAAAIGGLYYEDEFVTREEQKQAKQNGKRRWTGLPEITVFSREGTEVVTIGESNACLRYIGSLAGLYPTNNRIQRAYVDEIIDSIEDVINMISPSIREQNAEKRKEMRLKLMEDEKLPYWLNKFEQRLKENEENGNKNGYFVADNITIADLKFYFVADWLTNHLDGNKLMHPNKRCKSLVNLLKQNISMKRMLHNFAIAQKEHKENKKTRFTYTNFGKTKENVKKTATLSDFNKFKNKLLNDEMFRNDVILAHKEWCAVNGYVLYFHQTNAANINTRDINYDNDNKDNKCKPNLYRNQSTALYPTIIEKNDYLQLYSLSKIYHKLFDAMARDSKFMISILKNVAKNDSFIANYLKIYKAKYESKAYLNQATYFGVFRTDYMQNKSDKKWGLIEINTASPGGWQCSQKGHDLNKYILSRYAGLNIQPFDVHNVYENKNENNNLYYPQCNTLNAVCSTLAKAAKLVHPSAPYILMVTHKYRNENLVIEQRMIEYKLFNDYNIPCIRRSLTDLVNVCKLDAQSNELIIYDKYKISVVYMRNLSAVFPELNDESVEQWKVLQMIEFSTAINESVAYFLMGTKYMQAICYNKDILLKYLNKNEADTIHKHMFKTYTLDNDTNINLKHTIADIKQNPSQYVIKPQRECGGNCYFDNDIIELFDKLDEQNCAAYIAMQRIYPSEYESWLLYESMNKCVYQKKSSSEIGFFSCYLSDGITTHVNEVCGTFAKTRPSDATEGGVSHGIGVHDSILILDK